MIKKILAGTLSVLFVASSFITGNNNYVIECDKRQSDAILNDGKNQYDLQATNSLGNYITQSAKDNNINPDIKPLSNNINETFNITNLGFDAESGIIVATSTQTQNCTIVFSFIDEDTKQIIQEVKRNIEQGEYVLTEAKADIASLSQYYTVQAQLTDIKGKVISNTFKLDKYTRIMQEIAATDIHDFDGAQVVNFDDNDDTNFLVLSEGTVKAECSEEENTLVSADYDSSTFVFENINESIRYLQNGDLLYIQPDDENIIAVEVDDVDIDGDTATIMGGDNIDDMFEFIKIESQMETGDIEVDATEADEEVSYPQYNEKRFFYPSNQMLDFNVNMKNAIKYNYEKEYTFRFPRDELFDDKFFGVEAELYGNITFKVNFSFFKKKEYKSSGFSITCIDSITFNLGGELNWDANQLKRYKDEKSLSADEYEYLYDPDRIPSGDYEYEYDPEKNKESFDKHKADLEKRIELGGFKIPTGVPGIFIGVQPVLVLSASGSIEVTVIVSRSWGYVYNSNDGFQKLSDDDSEYDGCSVKIGGEVFIGLQLKAELLVIHEKLLAVSLEVTAGLVTSAETEIDVIDEVLEKQSESGHVVITDKDEDYIHSCALCFYGTVSLRVKFGITVSIVKQRFEFPLEATHDFPLPFDWCEYCFGITSKPYTWHNDLRVAYDDNPEEKVCPYNKYKVEFIITDENKGNGLEGAEVTIDGLTQNTNSEGRAVFYCDNGSYSYQLQFGNKTQSGTVNVDHNKVSIPCSFDWELSDDGEIKVNKATVTSYKDGNRKTVTTTARTTKKLVTETVCKEEDQIFESIQLGDHIWGFIYPDNTMRIYGYGDMYSDRDFSLNNVKNITEVFFDDIDSENNRYITSIGKHLFDGAENLEVVYLSNEITKIDDYAFYGCKNLKCFRYGGENDTSKTLVLPSKLKSVGFRTFRDCESAMFGDLEFGNDFEKLGCDAFWNCDEITSVNVPVNVNTVEPTVFWGCDNLKNAVIKADVSTVGPGLFYACNALEEITLPSSISIKSDKISETYCLKYLFSNHNSSSPSIDIPDTLTRINVLNGEVIHNSTFEGFENLKTIALPQGIIQIGARAFYGCKQMNIICSDEEQDLTFSELFADLETIGGEAFKGDVNILIGDLVFGEKFKLLGWDSFWDCKGIKSVVIPANVTEIQVTAFWGCDNLKNAVIKADVSTIGPGLFYACNALEEITLPGFISLKSNKISETYCLKYLFSNHNSSSPRIDIPDSLTRINVLNGDVIHNSAFEGFENVKTIALPQGITQIGARAFYGCKQMNIICSDEEQDLTFSELFADLESIGGEAFKGDVNILIGDLVFGEKFKLLGWDSFWDCKGITSVVIPANVTEIQVTAFWGCSNIKKAVIKADVNTIGPGLFYACNALEEMTLPAFVSIKSDKISETYCLKYLFSNHNSSSPRIDIPDTLTRINVLKGQSIPENCFNDFRNVKVLVLPSELITACQHATYDMNALEEVYYNGPDEIWADITEHALETQNDPLYIAKIVKSEVSEYVYGDANGDGELDMSDAVLIMQALANPNKYGVNGTDPKHITADGFKYADADGNGLTVKDALRIQQYLLGTLDSLVV